MEGVKAKVLAALRTCRGEYLSGEELSRRLRVSRTAVWKAIRALQGEGYVISSRPRQGYRLEGIPDLLLPAEIRHCLGTRWLGRQIYYEPVLASTNDLARKLARQGAAEGTLVVTEEQTRGRGRLGRTWYCPRGKGLLFSLLLRPFLQPARAPQLTLLAAVALAETIRAQASLAAAIKWPNDIYIEGKKVAGILTELSAEVDRVNFVVLGIGLNVNTDPEDLPPDLQSKATSLKAQKGEGLSRVRLLQGILVQLEEEYTRFLKEGFAPLRERWKELALGLGREVRVFTPEETLRGVALDLDEEGALLVETGPGVVRRVLAGDVSFR